MENKTKIDSKINSISPQSVEIGKVFASLSVIRRHQLSLLFLFIVYLFALSNSSGKGGERPLPLTIGAQEKIYTSYPSPSYSAVYDIPLYAHSAVWTGTEMIVWGGYGGAANVLNTGRRYNPIADTWTATSTTSAPSARSNHTAVWTGTEMIVWGGNDGSNYLSTGGRYNPATDTWTATTTTNAPSGRANYTAVWTGTEMIVWGGYDGGYFNTGGRYNPCNRYMDCNIYYKCAFCKR